MAAAKPASATPPPVASAPAAVPAAVLADRVRGALYGLLIADALSAPVHWYYSTGDIVREHGVLRNFAKPPAKHPSSILSLSSTGGAGRGGQQGNIIGDVINHGKKHLWGVPNTHYHGTLAAGENTLNAQVARVLIRDAAASRGWSPAAFLRAYIAFMRAPGSHNDTYAETYHRMFFVNLVQRGLPAERCADDDGHNVASAGGLVLLPPPALLAASAALGAGAAPAPAAADAAAAQMYTTHNSPQLERYARVYGRALARALAGDDLRAVVAAAGRDIGVDVAALAAKHGAGREKAVVGGTYSTACYIDGSFPSLLYLAYLHADNPEAALIANTNAGGENCHRGSALGALLGAARGMAAWPDRWTTKLVPADAIAAEVDAFADLCVDAAAGKLPAAAAGDGGGADACAAPRAGERGQARACATA
jgi:ADP-ribosylglycohydrolase